MNRVKGRQHRSAISKQLSPVYILEKSLGLLVAPLVHLEQWRQHQQVSMQFAHVDPRILRDVGISEAQRFIEVNRPFE